VAANWRQRRQIHPLWQEAGTPEVSRKTKCDAGTASHQREGLACGTDLPEIFIHQRIDDRISVA
jgi:hypothetical protein